METSRVDLALVSSDSVILVLIGPLIYSGLLLLEDHSDERLFTSTHIQRRRSVRSDADLQLILSGSVMLVFNEFLFPKRHFREIFGANLQLV